MTSLLQTVNDLPNIRVLEEGEPYYNIWNSAWHAAESMFSTMHGTDGTDAPVLCMDDPNGVLSQILVRPEYAQAYNDAQLLFFDDFQEVPPERLFEVPNDPPTFTLEDALEGLRSDDQIHPTGPCTSALVVTGHPGIGKSVFLLYVLVRRLAIQKMVVFQDDPTRFYVFHESGVVEIPTAMCHAHRILKALSYSTWCLIDGNEVMGYVKPFTVKLHRFTIQATSPNARKLKDWFAKTPMFASIYIMKPMSLKEVLLCRDCLIKPSKSIDQIQKSYNRFGPSTWVSLHNRDSLWIEDVIRAFQLLGESTTILAEVMNNLEHAIDNHPDISSILFLLQPGKYRHERRVGVITNDILSLLKDWVNCVVIQGGRLPHRHAEWILRSQISC